MKKLLLILSLFTAFLTNQLSAQDSTFTEPFLSKNAIDRSFYTEKQLKLYSILPSSLWLWDYEDYSVISFNGNYDKGSFKTVDDFKQNAQFSFKTSSIQSFDESGWRFYGEFNMDLSNHKSVDWNVFFKKSDIGSPFRIVTGRRGDFNAKHYGLTGMVSKKFGERLSLGVTLKYYGDIYLRIRDIRNEQYNLSTEFIVSANYKLSDFKNIALGISYIHKKSQPSFSAQFLATSSEFDMDILSGLGDYHRIQMSDQLFILNNNPKAYINYFAGKKHKLTLSYSFFLGKELWKNRITKLNSSNAEEMYKYEYMDQEFIGSYLIKKESYSLLNKFSARYISGDGYQNISQNSIGYQKTYIYTGLNALASTDLLRHNKKLFRQSSLSFGFENVSKKDMSYAHRIDYTNVYANMNTNYYHPLNENVKLVFEINATYNYNLDYTHNVVSAGQKPYTLNIAYNEVAYHTADYLKLGTGIRLLAKIKNIKAEFTLNYAHLKPIDIKLTNTYSLVKKTDYRNFWNASINLYF